MLHHSFPSKPDAPQQVRAWQAGLRWVVLWGVLSALGGLQTGATLWTLGSTPLAIITACLFGWADLLGLGAALHALVAE